MAKAAVLSFVEPLTFDSARRLLTAVNAALNDGYTDLTLLISSPGGQLIPGFAVYNQLLGIPIDFTVHNTGSVNSIANAIFLAGKVRYASPSATFLFHGTQWGVAQAAELPRTQLAEILHSLDADEKRLRDILVEKTKLTAHEATDLLDSGVTKDATFALEKGFIDKIIEFTLPAGVSIYQI